MEPAPHPVFSDLEQDAEASVAEAFARIAVEYFAATRSGEGPRLDAARPGRAGPPLRRAAPASRAGRSRRSLERLRRDVVPDSNHLCHPRSMGHQVSAPLPAAVWTESLVAALNQSVAVWEMSPVGTVLETRVVRWMCDLAGLGSRGGRHVHLGRDRGDVRRAPRRARGGAARTPGRRAWAPPPRSSSTASTRTTRWRGRSASWGSAPTTRSPSPRAASGWTWPRSRPSSTGSRPAGGGSWPSSRRPARPRRARSTTSRRSAGSARSGASWLHVDGAHGASALFSPAHRGRLRGIERARSIAWDPHKMMLMPLSAGVVLVRDERDLDAGFAPAGAVPLPRPRGRAGLGPGRAQLPVLAPARRAEGLGGRSSATARTGLGALYDHLCATAARAPRARSARAPTSRRSTSPSRTSSASATWATGRSTPSGSTGSTCACGRSTTARATGWITTTVLGGRRVLRVTVMNPRTTGADVERTLDRLAEMARSSSAV